MSNNRLMISGIPCLPVHDSYVVPEEYEDTLIQAMVEEYEKEMGRPPVIKNSSGVLLKTFPSIYTGTNITVLRHPLYHG